MKTKTKELLVFGMLGLSFCVFELSTISSIEFALADILGKLSIFGTPWKAILAFALYSIDLVAVYICVRIRRSSPQERAPFYLLIGTWILIVIMRTFLIVRGITLASIQRGVNLSNSPFMMGATMGVLAIGLFLFNVAIVIIPAAYRGVEVQNAQ
jgi:signal transduction histidine kinase